MPSWRLLIFATWPSKRTQIVSDQTAQFSGRHRVIRRNHSWSWIFPVIIKGRMSFLRYWLKLAFLLVSIYRRWWKSGCDNYTHLIIEHTVVNADWYFACTQWKAWSTPTCRSASSQETGSTYWLAIDMCLHGLFCQTDLWTSHFILFYCQLYSPLNAGFACVIYWTTTVLDRKLATVLIYQNNSWKTCVDCDP